MPETLRRRKTAGLVVRLLALSWLVCGIDSVMAQIDAARVTITFIAPGDDRTLGRAAAYEIRYSLSPITALSWNQASRVPDALPPPNSSRTIERITVTIPNALLGAKYYLAMRTRDEAFNWSPVSNSAFFVYGSDSGIEETSVTRLR